MKAFLVLLCATLCWSTVLCTEFPDADNVTEEVGSNVECKPKLFSIKASNHTIKKRSEPVLDCFGIGKGFFDKLFRKKANGTKALKIEFHLSTRNVRTPVTLYSGDKFNFHDNIDFDITKRTVIIVHGFYSSGEEEWVTDMTRALLELNDVNIIAVDWSDGANTWNYAQAAINTRTVGDQIATLLHNLAFMRRMDLFTHAAGTIHCIGHSLGAHICGYLSSEIKKRRSNRMPFIMERITGLDPAQPCFKTAHDDLRLDKTDAIFVDVIHTNGRHLKKLGLGLPEPMGHIDFYPNGGKIQPGCKIDESKIASVFPITTEKVNEMICSHGRAYLYFIDSILATIQNNCAFWSHEWDLTDTHIDNILRRGCDAYSCIEMGIGASKYSFHRRGAFFTVTGSNRPFCRVNENDTNELRKILKRSRKSVDCIPSDIPEYS